MILLIDNYDSFTYNLCQYISHYAGVEVCRNDDNKLYTLAAASDGLIFSPGPGWPRDAGKIIDMIRYFSGEKPILGICLGHQAIAETFGGRLKLAGHVMHGKQSILRFEKSSKIFEGLQNGIEVMRYHSIVVDHVPKEFQVIARATDDLEIMGIQNESLKIYGLQYHPESIGTPDGMVMIGNFVQIVESCLVEKYSKR